MHLLGARQHILLSSIAQVLAPFPFRGGIVPDAEGDALVLQLKDVSPDAPPNWESVLRTRLVGRKPFPFLRQDDILLVTRGSRYFAVHLEEIPESAVASPHFFIVRVNTKLVLPAYLAWLCSYGPAQQFWAAQEAGSAQRSLRRADVENLPLPMPLHSLAAQVKIGELVRRVQRHKQLLQHLMQADERLLHTLATQIYEAHHESH